MCVQSCPFDLLKAEHHHYRILVGGRRGRHPHIARDLITINDEETVVFVVENIVNWVYRRAWSGRLLSDQMDNIEFEKFKAEVVKEIDGRKEKETK